MARIAVLKEDVSLREPTLVEGLPGVGLVGKIAADYLVETLDMVHYANVHCEGIPRVAVYDEKGSALSTPVRLYATEDGRTLVLQSDVPVNPQSATEFADCVADWLEAENVLPLLLSGIPTEDYGEEPEVIGVTVGDAEGVLARANVDSPTERGLVSGPTGALLAHAIEHDAPAVGLLVESAPRFPDPTAAATLLKRGITPIADVEVDVAPLRDSAKEIQSQKERLAKQMQEAGDESSKAQPLRMFQ